MKLASTIRQARHLSRAARCDLRSLGIAAALVRTRQAADEEALAKLREAIRDLRVVQQEIVEEKQEINERLLYMFAATVTGDLFSPLWAVLAFGVFTVLLIPYLAMEMDYYSRKLHAHGCRIEYRFSHEGLRLARVREREIRDAFRGNLARVETSPNPRSPRRAVAQEALSR